MSNPYEAAMEVVEDKLGQGLRAYFGEVTALAWPRVSVNINGTVVTDVLIACDPHPMVGDTAVVLLQGSKGFVVGRFTDNSNYVSGIYADGFGADNDDVAVGSGARTLEWGATAVGSGARAAESATAIGVGTRANGDGSVHIGVNGRSNGSSAIAIKGTADKNQTIAIGWASNAGISPTTPVQPPSGNGENAIAIGTQATALEGDSVAIGVGSRANGIKSFALGSFATANHDSEGVVRCTPLRILPTAPSGDLSGIAMKDAAGSWWLVTISGGALTVTPYFA